MKEIYGNLTVGHGTPQQREISIVEFIKAAYPEGRNITVSKTETGEFVLLVENTESSGRSNQKMWLSKESTIALFSTLAIYFNGVGVDPVKELEKQTKGLDIHYSSSKNISKKFPGNSIRK